jgi:hypothetical protein
MKIYILIRNYYDFCDNWETELGYYTDKDLVEYLADELNKKYTRKSFGDTTVSFIIKEASFNTGKLEDWESELVKITSEFGSIL